MNNITSVKTKNGESPKTPGGISKALLTPCRRVGLSRNWKKSGSSPFISPLSSTNTNTERNQEHGLRKRKRCSAAEVLEVAKQNDDPEEDSSCITTIPDGDRTTTPTRNILPRKKSKCILAVNKYQNEINENLPQSISDLNDKNILVSDNANLQEDSIKCNSKVSKLSLNNSESKPQILGPVQLATEKDISLSESSNCNVHISLKTANSETQLQNGDNNVKKVIKKESPKKLTKECMVVIQKKMFKTDKLTDKSYDKIQENLPSNKLSQTLFNLDSEDLPLSTLNRKNDKLDRNNGITVVEDTQDDDFIDKTKVTVKTKNKMSSSSETKNKTKGKNKTSNVQTKPNPKTSSQSSSSFDDDDDDFVNYKKKTILIKKTYDKIAKPTKAKSTGSITQEDIDDVKARIESKKNILLAKAMSHETQELRDLIKKWQAGCQTALMQLLELMKKNMPEQNMEHSELLQMLKIPPDLVGYDSENDCFNTPEDTNIILSALKLN